MVVPDKAGEEEADGVLRAEEATDGLELDEAGSARRDTWRARPLCICLGQVPAVVTSSPVGVAALMHAHGGGGRHRCCRVVVEQSCPWPALDVKETQCAYVNGYGERREKK
jgi:hypothetical protein